eukprot:2108570-Prymnesium_polylepis.1
MIKCIEIFDQLPLARQEEVRHVPLTPDLLSLAPYPAHPHPVHPVPGAPVPRYPGSRCLTPPPPPPPLCLSSQVLRKLLSTEAVAGCLPRQGKGNAPSGTMLEAAELLMPMFTDVSNEEMEQLFVQLIHLDADAVMSAEY